MYENVKNVSVLSHGLLSVTFESGLQGIIRVMPSFYRGVFERLKDPEEFNKVKVSNGYITWPGDLDIAPDALYDSIVQHGDFVLR